MFDGGMDVALVAGDHPGRDVFELAAAILDAAVVVADDANGGVQLEVLHFAAAPDEVTKVL